MTGGAPWPTTPRTSWSTPSGSRTISTTPNIRIVEVDENPALYAEAHIPGAIGFDWKKDLQDQVKRDFLGPEDFGELFGSRGISNDHTIVLYGDRNNWFAAYTYWYLKYYGHDDVKLMNGPREKWIAEGRPTTDRRPEPTSRRRSPPSRATTRSAPSATRSSPRWTSADAARRRPLAAGVLRRADRDARLRAGGRAARRPHPRRRVGPVGAGGAARTARSSPRDDLEQLYGDKGVTQRRPDHRLLPHRRALGAHVVRAARAARQGRRQELRRLVDRVGQPRRRPDREGRLEPRRRASRSATIRAVAPQIRWSPTA